MYNRFTPTATGFSLFRIDKHPKRWQREGTSEVDDVHAPVPTWRKPQMTSDPHQDHEINIIVSGVARYVWGDDHTTTVGAGQLFLVPGGLSHILEVDEHVIIRGLWIHPDEFKPLLYPAFIHDDLWRLTHTEKPLPPRVIDDTALYHTLDEIYAQGQHQYSLDVKWRDEYLKALGRMAAITFIRLMLSTRRAQADSPTQLRVRNLQAWLDRHYAEEISVEDMAARVSLSPSRFIEVFRELSGQSPKAYVLERRMEQALSYLLTSQMSITEIANRTGFSHLANFNHLFKKRNGLTPSEYRKSRRDV